MCGVQCGRCDGAVGCGGGGEQDDVSTIRALTAVDNSSMRFCVLVMTLSLKLNQCTPRAVKSWTSIFPIVLTGYIPVPMETTSEIGSFNFWA